MLDAPKVTYEDVQKAIKGETYTVLPDGRTTICQLTLDNGFTVDGHSACVSIANFDKEVGEKYSREKAEDKVWAFLAFRLSDQLAAKLAQVPDDFVSRLKVERDEVQGRLTTLTQFLAQPTVTVGSDELDLMVKQHAAMLTYVEALTARLTLHGSAT